MFVFGSEFLGYTSNKLTSNDTLELENIIDKYSEKMEKTMILLCQVKMFAVLVFILLERQFVD